MDRMVVPAEGVATNEKSKAAATATSESVVIYLRAADAPEPIHWSCAGGGWDTKNHKSVYKMARDILKQIKGKNKSETAKNIVNWVHNNVWYATVHGKQTFEGAAYRCFTQHNGDCYGYYCTTKILLDCAGIENMMVRRYPIQWSAHYWILVKIGDKWYHCDSTVYRYHWNVFFKLTDKGIRDSHHKFNGSILPVRAGGSPQYIKDQEKEQKKE